MTKVLSVRAPASSANLGPGFDALSIALGVYLNVRVEVRHSLTHPCLLMSYEGVNAASINTNVWENLIGKTILHVAERTKAELPSNEIHIIVHNEIPLSKGMGSSAAAVVAGCTIANELCNLKLTKLQLMKFALEIENHPDNLSACFFGGFVVSCVDPVSGEPFALSTEVSKQVQATVVVPDIEKKSTSAARAVLPETYSRADAVFNIQRTALLTSLLSKDREIDSTAHIFTTAMQDKIHQPYRKHLVPGLEEILNLPRENSLLGVCMSGAGPSVLALTKSGSEGNRESIAQSIQGCFAKHNVKSVPYMVEIDNTGTWSSWAEQ